MNRIVAITGFIVVLPFWVLSQVCNPNIPTGTPGLTPQTEYLPCMERGVFYDETIYLENFKDITIPGIGQLTINSLRIDSITNIPCNITWTADQIDRTYAYGETGCISVTGTTYDSSGQYKLGLYFTLTGATPFGTQTISGEASQLVDSLQTLLGVNLGIDFNYYVRVVDSGMICPALDTTSSANNLTASNSCADLSQISLSISGADSVCAGDSTELAVMVSGGFPPYTYAWGPAGSLVDTADSVVIAVPGSATIYSVTVSDGLSTSSTNHNISLKNEPDANFGFTPSGNAVTFTNFSDYSSQWEWDFGDGNTSTAKNPNHLYTQGGMYEVQLVAMGECGADTITKTVDLPTGIDNVEQQWIAVYPNPAKGLFEVSIFKGQVKSYRVALYDVQGKQALSPSSGNITISGSRFRINAANLERGLYILVVKSQEHLYKEKVIIY